MHLVLPEPQKSTPSQTAKDREDKLRSIGFFDEWLPTIQMRSSNTLLNTKSRVHVMFKRPNQIVKCFMEPVSLRPVHETATESKEYKHAKQMIPADMPSGRAMTFMVERGWESAVVVDEEEIPPAGMATTPAPRARGRPKTKIPYTATQKKVVGILHAMDFLSLAMDGDRDHQASCATNPSAMAGEDPSFVLLSQPAKLNERHVAAARRLAQQTDLMPASAAEPRVAVVPTVRDICQRLERTVHVVYPNARTSYAAALMRQHQLVCLPVVSEEDGCTLVGLYHKWHVLTEISQMARYTATRARFGDSGQSVRQGSGPAAAVAENDMDEKDENDDNGQDNDEDEDGNDEEGQGEDIEDDADHETEQEPSENDQMNANG